MFGTVSAKVMPKCYQCARRSGRIVRESATKHEKRFGVYTVSRYFP